MSNISTDTLTAVSTETAMLMGNGSNVSTVTPPVFSDRSVAEILQGKMNTVQYFVCPTLLVFGIFGNLFTVLTVSHPQFHQMTSRYILYALATSDSLLLLTNPFNQQFMLHIWNRDVRAFSEIGCKLFFVMYRTGKMSSSWFIVLIAIERFIAIMFPLQARRLLTKATVSIAISFIYIAMFSITGIWTFSTNVVKEMCMSDVTSANTINLHKSFVVVGATCYSIAPIIILLTVTPVIIVKLYRSQRLRQGLHHSNVGRCAKETSRVTVMLIGIVISYVICVTPITLVLILTFWTNEPFFSSQKTEFIILTGVAMSFEQVNHSSNFLVYVICCRQFRERFFRMVKCKNRRRRYGAESLSLGTVSSGIEAKSTSFTECHSQQHCHSVYTRKLENYSIEENI